MTEREAVWRLAREAGCDERTARKAVRGGADAVKGYDLRDRLVAAASRLRISLPVAPAPTDEERAP